MARLNQRQDTVNSQALDALRRKFGAQNRAIAKSHAALEDKIAQLEQATGQLMNENYELRCENMKLRKDTESRNTRLRDFLSSKWLEIEQFLCDENAGAGAANKSFVSGEPGEQLVQLDTITKRKRKVSDEERFIDEGPTRKEQDMDVSCNDGNVGMLMEDSIPEEEEEEEEDVVHEDNEDPVPMPVVLPVHEEPVLKEIEHSLEEQKPALEPPKQEEKPALEPPKQEQQQEAQSSPSKPTKPAKQAQPPRKPLGTKSTNEKTTNKKSTKDKQPARKKQKTLPIENETMPQTLIESPVRSRRSSRGKQVSYALPSLRTKMRREKDELVDAVTTGSEPLNEQDLVQEVKREAQQQQQLGDDLEPSKETTTRRASTGSASVSRRKSSRTRKSLAT